MFLQCNGCHQNSKWAFIGPIEDDEWAISTVGTPVTLPLSKQNAEPLTAVSFATDKIGFVGSKSGIIYKTTNGGATWTAVYTASEPILGIDAIPSTVNGPASPNVVAWTKDTIFDSETGTSFSRVQFNGTNTTAIGSGLIEDVAAVPNGEANGDHLVVVSSEDVWSSDSNKGGWLKRTPPVPVTSIATLDASTWYAATTSGSVYKTTDFGQRWTLVFSTSLDKTQEWNVAIQASGNHVAVLYTCNAGAANQRPYILFNSNDAGQTWDTMFDQSLFQSLYGRQAAAGFYTARSATGPIRALAAWPRCIYQR